MERLTLTRRIRGLLRLSDSARRDLVRAQLALLRAQLKVRFAKRGKLLSAVNPRQQPRDSGLAATADQLARARELAIAVRRVASYGLFRAHCLARALAISHLMKREGMADAVIRVGVAMRDSRLIAHAWVEYRGTQLVESTVEVRDLQEVEGLRVSPVA